jgi:hypothetical protein
MIIQADANDINVRQRHILRESVANKVGGFGSEVGPQEFRLHRPSGCECPLNTAAKYEARARVVAN